MPSSLPEVLAAQSLFLILLPLVLAAPLRWALLAWLIMGNLDTTGPSLAVSDGIGWMNACKGVLLPLYLWWRLRNTSSELLPSLPTRLWLLLTGYATIACLWSPFPLAAVKPIGNMVGILISLVVLEKAARRGVIQGQTITLLIVTSLALGALQTFYYGGMAYGFDGAGQPTRFSSFVSAQQYAAFLVAFLAAALWYPNLRQLVRWVLVSGVIGALVLNGSRTWVLGATLAVFVYVWYSSRRITAYVTLAGASMVFGTLLVLNLSPLNSGLLDGASSRVMATLRAIVTGQDTPHDVGLANLNFRLSIYSGAVNELRTEGMGELLFGHGTSWGAEMYFCAYFHAHIELIVSIPIEPSTTSGCEPCTNGGLSALAFWWRPCTTFIVALVLRHRKQSGKHRAPVPCCSIHSGVSPRIFH